MDSARVALRLGADDVTIVYRRSEDEMPARIEEIENAKDEGVKFQLLTAPVKFFGDENGGVSRTECVKMELAEPDSSGRRRPVPVNGSEFIIESDTVIIAVGQRPNPLFIGTIPGIKTGVRGNIVCDENTGATSLPGVFAGGDIATGAATVIEAMGAGKKAAVGINDYIQQLNKGKNIR
jgi:glutamate synthase (NADPH/NADH) small chain